MKFFIPLCCAISALAAATSVNAAGYWSQTPFSQGASSTVTAAVGAEVLPPFVISGNSTPMLLANNAPEWLGSSRISNSDQPLLLGNSVPTNMVLNIAGEPGTAFSISIPKESMININNGRQTLLLSGTLSADLESGLLDPRGHHSLIINADFSLPNTMKLHGLFSGHFPVTVEHN